jgi:IMP dehydrogenase
MNGVTGRRMAEALARLGGIGILPQDMDRDTLERIIRFVKEADPLYDTPLVVDLQATLRDTQDLIYKRNHGLVVVVNEHHQPQGVVSPEDIQDSDQFTPVTRLMTPAPFTLPVGFSPAEAYEALERNRVHAAPVVDEEGHLCGVVTQDTLVRQTLVEPSLDTQGRLMVGAALGIAGDPASQARFLLEQGADVLVLDTAHGHQKRMLEAIAAVRSAIGDQVPLVAGNVCTEEGTRDLLEAGADIIKVNIGPGAMCTTRMQTGVGRPSFSAVLRCAETAQAMGRHVWADGGVRAPRDVALYLAAGASRVMVGSLFAGTYESPGDIRRDIDGHLYKDNHGMASMRAVRERNQEISAFERALKELYREGISSSHIRLKKGQESVGDLVTQMITGLQSAFTYQGASQLEEFHRQAIVGVQTLAGYEEGKPRPNL